MTNNESLTSLNRRLTGAEALALTAQTTRTLGGLKTTSQSDLTKASLRDKGLLNADGTLTERAENLRELRDLLS